MLLLIINQIQEEENKSFWIVPVVFFGVWIIVGAIYFVLRKKHAKNDLFTTKNINNNLLKLAAIIVKADGKIDRKEIDYVKQYLNKKLKKSQASYQFQIFNEYLNSEVELDDVLTEIKETLKQNINSSGLNYFVGKSEINWLYFLVGIALTDKFLAKDEFNVINTIRSKWSIDQRAFNSLLAMFNYYTEEDVNRQQSVKKYAGSSLSKYFTILELKDSATTEEIKKSYRKLVQLYHPDKQINKTPIEQQQAEEQFKKIQEAYEIIKERKGFN